MTRSSHPPQRGSAGSRLDYQAVNLDLIYQNRHEFKRTDEGPAISEYSSDAPPMLKAPHGNPSVESEAPSPYYGGNDDAGLNYGAKPPYSAPMDGYGARPTTSSDASADGGLRRDPGQAWEMVREDLRHSMAGGMFKRFVADSWVAAYEDGEFIIGVPDSYAADWLAARLRTDLKRRLGRYLGRQSITLAFVVQSGAPAPGNGGDELAGLPLFSQTESPIAPPRMAAADARLAALQAEAAAEVRMDSRPRRSSASVFDAVPPAPSSGRGGLQPDLTFDSFVVGDHNRMAHAAATAVAEKPGQNFNPLFIYGGVGLGKTHLLHAIGNAARRRQLNVIYCTSEHFTNDLIRAIGERSTDAFRARYRQADILLIDDIQFLRDKERTQEEFFHTFNHLHEAGAQIVLTSDRPPKALAPLEERLRSRFEGGLQTDIAPPDVETRVAILEQKAIRLGMKVDRRILMAVAERFESNIRELEGALNQLNWQSQLARTPLTYETAIAIVDNLAPARRPANPPDVVRIVAQHYGVTAEDLMGRSRRQPLAHVRQIAMYLLREENGLSLHQVGLELGGRDHSTIAHGADKIVSQLQDDDALRLEISKLREKIYTPLL